MKVRQHNSTLSVDTDKPLRRGKPLARGKRKRQLSVPPETTMAVRARSEGKCVVCVHQGRERPKKAEHRHPDHHWAHEYSPNFKIPLLALPECVFRLAADVGPAAVDYLLSRYGDGSRLAREAG